MVAAAFGEDSDGCVQRTQLSLEDLVFLFGSPSSAGTGSGGGNGNVPAVAAPAPGDSDGGGTLHPKP